MTQGLSKTLVAVLLHTLLTLGVLLAVLAGPLQTPGLALGAILLSQLAVPGLFLLSCVARGRKVRWPIRGAYLYWVFLWARSLAVTRQLLGRRIRRG